jgi:hypothetical protein
MRQLLLTMNAIVVLAGVLMLFVYSTGSVFADTGLSAVYQLPVTNFDKKPYYGMTRSISVISPQSECENHHQYP